MHENWSKTSHLHQLTDFAVRRKLEDLTIGQVLTVTTEAILDHMKKLLQIPGSNLLFGGEELENHYIPSIHGAIKPTVEQILKAMTMLLSCLKDCRICELQRQRKENNKPQEECFKLPYMIDIKKVEIYLITQSYNKQENWTRALKHTLCNLKWALYW